MDLIIFIGRFHPLLVHLPIGFLMLAVILEVTERFSITKGLKVAVPFTLLLGTLSGAVACILGLMLASSGDYSEATLNNHQWAGILTTVVAGFAYTISKNWINIQFFKEKGYALVLALMMIGLTITGHLGGNMTHGETYLTEYMPFKSQKVDELTRPVVTEIAKAQLFGDIVHPIIKKKCMSCHNASKQKGKLSFASIEDYLRGGKHGNTIVAGDALKSELLVRVNLDPDHEEFMPTDGKIPLTEDEKTLITYWIANANADFDTLLMATEPDEKTIGLVNHFLKLGDGGAVETLNFNVSTVSQKNITDLEKTGFTVRELIAGANIFDVVLTKKQTTNITEQLNTLTNIQDNIIRLSLENVGLKNSDLDIIGQFKNLQQLNLSQNVINDENIKALTNLENLESINLYQTNISAQSLEILSQLPKLQRIYLWQTNVKSSELAALQEQFSKVELIGGS